MPLVPKYVSCVAAGALVQSVDASTSHDSGVQSVAASTSSRHRHSISGCHATMAVSNQWLPVHHHMTSTFDQWLPTHCSDQSVGCQHNHRVTALSNQQLPVHHHMTLTAVSNQQIMMFESVTAKKYHMTTQSNQSLVFHLPNATDAMLALANVTVKTMSTICRHFIM